MSDKRSEGLQDGVGDSGPDNLVDAFDRVLSSLPPGDPIRRDLLELRPQIFDQQETMVEARRMIEKLEEVIKKVTSPANRIGTFLGATSKDTAHIVVGGADYYCNIDPRIPLAKLKKGTRVLVNEAFVIVGDLGFETAGPVTKITEVLGKDRLRVGSEHGLQSMVLQRSADLVHSTLKSGDEVRVDSNYRMALEMLSGTKSHEHYLDTVPELPWENVGGRIGANGARNFCHRSREERRRLHAISVHRRGRIDSRHPPRIAALEYSFHARADVLFGNGRNRFAQRRCNYPCFQSRRSD